MSQSYLHSEPKDSFESFWPYHNILFTTHSHNHDLLLFLGLAVNKISKCILKFLDK